MVLVIADGPPRRFVAAVAPTRAAAEAYLHGVPASARSGLYLHESPALSLPCFLVETARALETVDHEGLVAQLRAWSAEADPAEDQLHGNVYALHGPWLPDDPTVDAMGALPHTHVTRSHLDAFARGGIAEFLEFSGLEPGARR